MLRPLVIDLIKCIWHFSFNLWKLKGDRETENMMQIRKPFKHTPVLFFLFKKVLIE